MSNRMIEEEDFQDFLDSSVLSPTISTPPLINNSMQRVFDTTFEKESQQFQQYSTTQHPFPNFNFSPQTMMVNFNFHSPGTNISFAQAGETTPTSGGFGKSLLGVPTNPLLPPKHKSEAESLFNFSQPAATLPPQSQHAGMNHTVPNTMPAPQAPSNQTFQPFQPTNSMSLSQLLSSGNQQTSAVPSAKVESGSPFLQPSPNTLFEQITQGSAFFVPQPATTPSQTQPGSAGSALSTPSPPQIPQHAPQHNIIRLVEGFNKTVTKKQPGGRDNTKHTLPKQVVEINPSVVPAHIPITSLNVKAYVLGFDKVSRHKVILGELGESKFTETGNGPLKRWLATLTGLIIKFSSHLNGQKLALRFILYDNNKNQVCFVDSEEFETITKRGREKQAERQKRKRTNDEKQSSVEHVEPPIGTTEGGQIVKIKGSGFTLSPVSQVTVKFGEKLAKEIICVKRNVIICETPESETGSVDVTVSWDKKSPLPTNARFQYIDGSNTNDVISMLQYIFPKKGFFNNSLQQSLGTSSSTNFNFFGTQPKV